MGATKHCSRRRAEAGEAKRFRNIRTLGEDCNFHRFLHYVKAMGRLPELQRLHRRMRVKHRFSTRSRRAREPALTASANTSS